MSEPKSATDYLPRDEKPYHYPGDNCELERKALGPDFEPWPDTGDLILYWGLMLVVGALIGYMLARVL